jgi:hypothetical protein
MSLPLSVTNATYGAYYTLNFCAYDYEQFPACSTSSSGMGARWFHNRPRIIAASVCGATKNSATSPDARDRCDRRLEGSRGGEVTKLKQPVPPPGSND